MFINLMETLESFLFLIKPSRNLMGGSRVGDMGSGHPLKNQKNKGFLSNIGPDPLKHHKATKPAFN